jgi:hypothetical protein
LLCASGFAAETVWLGKADCRIAPVKTASPAEVSWTGGCVDGYASGKGVLAWTSPIFGKVTLDATLVRGEASGEALFKSSGYIYQGTTRNGMPHGEGYLQHEDNGGGWYEGALVDGLPHGKGTHLKFDRSRYTGDWVAGKRHGRGEASFATGGSYQGEWKNNVFDGQGTIVYAGAGHKYEGAFQGGRVAGLPKAEVATGRYAVEGRADKEWVLAYLPLKAAWGDLAPAQKNAFLTHFPALEAGDEPPFPIKGEGPLFEKLGRVNQTLGPVAGNLAIYVLVGKDGKPLSVTAYGAPTATIVRALSTIFMIEQYKPALCRGEPCEMVYPVHFRFSAVD